MKKNLLLISKMKNRITYFIYLHFGCKTLMSGMLTFWLLLFVPTASVNAEESADSLLKLFKSGDITENEKALICAKLGEQYLAFNVDSALHFAWNGLEVSLRNNFIKGQFLNYMALGSIKLKMDDLDEALKFFLTAKDLIDETIEPRDVIGLYLGLGNVYSMQTNLYRAQDAFYIGLQIAEEHNDSIYLPRFYNNIAIIYANLEDNSKSLEYYSKALKLFEYLKDPYFIGNTLNNIGNIYFELKKNDSAYFFLNKALKIEKQISNYYGLTKTYSNLGRLAFSEGRTLDALELYEKSESAADSLFDDFWGSRSYVFATIYKHKGDTHFQLKDYPKAIKFYHLSLSDATVSSDIETETYVSKKLADLFHQQGNKDSAYFYYKNFTALNDSLLRIKNNQKITELTLQYEYDKERKQQKLESELIQAKYNRIKLIYLLIIISAGASLLLIAFLYILQHNRMRRKNLEQKMMVIEKQKLSKELEFKNKELTTNVMYLLKKNEFISAISNKLKNTNQGQKEDHHAVIKNVISELDKSITQDTWTEFEVRFQEVHVDFYNSLSRQFPDLTPNELRLCAFLRLNMTSKEIADITYQSAESLKTARYRLRKKLGLDRDENLIAYLTKL
ncbi:MAG: tetratricopeptide repeat protein [Bacteroidales bacterium]|nr:tetratricopeptide repeat protein [Bacteroidales bacterium]